MPDSNPPPTYRWTVAPFDGQSFTVEAAYPVLDDGSMLLKDSDHKIVFAAASGACSFTRNGLAESPGVPRRTDGPYPASFDDLLAAWEKACVKAWDAGDGHWSPSVALPDFLWPHVAHLVNPVTGGLAKISRTSAFTWGPSVDGDRGESVTDESDRDATAEADAARIRRNTVPASEIRDMRNRPEGDGDGTRL